jgi:hypothetical protein
MTEQLWQALMQRLAQAAAAPVPLCVGCWYQMHQTPFPAQQSSRLCAACAVVTRSRSSVTQPAFTAPQTEGGHSL